MPDDYRNSSHCELMTNVSEKKIALEKDIRLAHPGVKIIYNQVRNRSNDYFRLFSNIYLQKCAYCGSSIRFTGIQRFEIDHYVCQSSFSDDMNGRATAGLLSNLIFACDLCNRFKGELLIDSTYRNILNPDDSSIARVFFRDENYYIRINREFESDPFVYSFYKQLKFDYQIRRLDFLLQEMDDLCSQLTDPDAKIRLEQAIMRLMIRKNCTLDTEVVAESQAAL